MSVFGINKKVKYVLSQAEVFEILDLKLASHSLFFWREGLFVWLSWIICYSESLNVSSLVCQSKSRLPGSYFTGRCKSILHFIMFLVGRRHNCVFFCSLLKAAPLFPSVWPSSEALRLAGAAVRQCRGGPWARCVCSALVEEGQLLSAAKEGTEEIIQCVRHGQWLVSESPPNSLSEPLRDKYGVRKKPWKISAKLSGVTRSGGLNCRCLEVFCCFPVVGPRRWRRLCPRSGVPVCPAPCKT